MEAVLVRAIAATGSATNQAHWHGLHVRATSIERSNFGMTQSASADTSRKVIGYCVSTAQPAPSNSQAETLGPLRISWNSNSNSQQFQLPEEPLQNYEGFVNYKTLDGSVADSNEDQVDREFTRVVHTQESFFQFLHQFPKDELKNVAQACNLSNLAYTISELKVDELFKDHKLRLVTSSVHRDNSGATGQFGITLAPATAYALAATASYLKSGDPSTRPRKGSETLSSKLLSRAVDHQLSSTMSSFMTDSREPCHITSEPITGVTNREEATTANPASICGWFACDELTTATRFFSIQGSESMASWKANLRFQPTQFEGWSTGVMVHKGVYEIAKSLYDQMLPLVQSHLAAFGMRAKISFTGHSLGGSIAVLLTLMFRYRGVVPVSALRQVYTFGAPAVMNGGNNFLKRLNFPPSHIQSVVISRDLVPRIFACDIPQQIVEVLKRVDKNFRSLPTNQRQLYTMVGRLVILQPEAQQAPGHPLLPSGSGIYILDQTATANSQDLHATIVFKEKELRAAESSFLNSPHPLDIMSDPCAYGSDGAISRDHDPRSYRRAMNHILKQTAPGIHQWKQLELGNFKDKMAKIANGNWPASPGSTPKRSKRIEESSVLCFNNNGFFSRASSSRMCHYLSLG